MTQGGVEDEVAANRVLEIRTWNAWLRKISEEQRRDQVVRHAREQLKELGRVNEGQLKGVTEHLR